MILNNQEWLLAIFKKKGLTPTGKLEFATIDGIDSALAQALNEAFDSQVVSFNDRTNQSFREFLKRTPRDRITLGTFSDVKEWLSSFEADRAGRKDTASAGPVNKLAMPLVNLSRSPAFSIYEGELCRDRIITMKGMSPMKMMRLKPWYRLSLSHWNIRYGSPVTRRNLLGWLQLH